MSSRVLATEEALRAAERLHDRVRDAIGAARAVLRAGQVLSDQGAWDGPAASEFRLSHWPQALDALQRSLTDMERLEATAERVLQGIMRAGSQGLAGGGMNTSPGIARWLSRAAEGWALFGVGEVVWGTLRQTRLEGWLKDAEQVQATLKAAVSAEEASSFYLTSAYKNAQTSVEDLVAKTRAAWRQLTDDRYALSEAAGAEAKRAGALLDQVNEVKATLNTDEARLVEESARVTKLEHGIAAVRAVGAITLVGQAGLDAVSFDAKYHDPSNAAGYSLVGALPVAGGMLLAGALGVGAAPEIAIGVGAAAVAIDLQTAYVYTYERRQQLESDQVEFGLQAAIDYNNSYVNASGGGSNQAPAIVVLGEDWLQFVNGGWLDDAAHETAKHIDEDFGPPIKLDRWI